MKSFFSLVNTVVGGNEKEVNEKALLPWEDYKEQAKGLGIRGSLKDVLRDEMSEIYTEEAKLLSKSLPLGDFDLDEKYDVIVKVLDNDLNLRELYRKVVPSKVKEDFFWRNYFEMTEEIKARVLKRYAHKDHSMKEMSEIRNSLLDELDKELEAEVQEVKVVKNTTESKSQGKQGKNTEKSETELEMLKKALSEALERISTLEKRVEALENEKNDKEKKPSDLGNDKEKKPSDLEEAVNQDDIEKVLPEMDS